MPSLVITQDTVTARLESQHVELVKHGPSGEPNDFVRIRVPLYDIDRVVINGRPALTIPLLQRFMRQGTPVYFLTSHGRWIGALSPDNNMNAGRRIRQYQISCDRTLQLNIASRIVHAKIRNSRRVIQRLAANRNDSESPAQLKCCETLHRLARIALHRPGNLDRLRGYEGMAAATYFSRIGAFFPDNIPFTSRSRRPPADAANSILSWTYSVLQGEIDAAIRSHGLDPCIGFLHAIEHGTPSLTLDLIEPLRAPMCDMLALHLLNHKILREEHFRFDAEDGGTYLKPEARKDFFIAYENSMTRKFSLKPSLPHTDFRKIIEQSVVSVLKAMEGESEYDFFLMP